jgi:thioredoxin 1
MSWEEEEEAAEPTRQEVDRMTGPVLLEFGARWCGYCRQLAPHVANLLRQHPEVRHVKVEDGPGKPLGRSFRVQLWVQLWPTLVFLRDGRVVAQAVRPGLPEVRAGLEAITAKDG